jgi:hypothetical protein
VATNALGPTMAGGLQPIVEDGYELLYLPDINNDALQKEGKAPVFYWLPGFVHIARKGGADSGDFMFNLIRFAGVQSADTTVGMTEGIREVAGGVLTFTSTSAPPDRVLQVSQDKIIAQWTANPDFFWGIRSGQKPVFRPAIITSNITTISNISPIANKGVPTFVRPDKAAGLRPGFRVMGATPPPQLPTVVRDGPVAENNLDPWYWQMQGQGAGSIDASGQNAFSALVGAYPTAILWQAFHGTASPVVVNQALKLKVWSPVVELRIHGEWTKIFEHFSAAVHAHYLWASVDIAVEINRMRTNGTLEVDVKVDQTLPGADKIAEQIDKRTDLVLGKFMEAAQKQIFEPPPPTVEPAHASGGGGPWGVGVALKYRRDETNLTLDYHETRQFAYLQDHTISSSLEGMYDEIKRDPLAEKKYFLSVYLDDWPRKLGRVFKPVINWASQPVAFLSAQVGYPNTRGELQWTGKTFQKADGDDARWTLGITQKEKADVAGPPAGWEPDKTFIKRKVHMLEPGDGFANPFVVTQIDQNVIDLDPEPNGTAMNDTTLEVRADSAGRLAVGPMSLGAVLDDARQTVEVTFDPTDENRQSLGREQVRMVWAYGDQDQPRFWSIYTGDPTFRPFFRYQVHVVVKGSLFAKGQAWLGPWVDANGNGPITIAVPTPDSEGVEMKEAPPIMVVGADGRVVREGMPSARREREMPATKPMTVAGYGADTSSSPAEREYAGSGDRAGHAANGASRSGPSTGNGHGEEEDEKEYRELEVTAWHA